jgi:hypothetical protein
MYNEPKRSDNSLIWFVLIIMFTLFLTSCEKEVIEYQVIKEPYPVYIPGDTIRDTTIIEKVPEYREFPVLYEFYNYTIEKMDLTNAQIWQRRNVGKFQHINSGLGILDLMDIKSKPEFIHGYGFIHLKRTEFQFTMLSEDSTGFIWDIVTHDLFHETWQRIEVVNGIKYRHTLKSIITREKIPY